MLTFLQRKKNAASDVGFRDDFTETDELPLPPWARTCVYSLLVLFLVLLAWACVYKIDKIVNGRGKFVITGREVVVRPLVDAIVKSIAVHTGQTLKKGQKILTLDPTFAEADLAQIEIQIANAAAVIYRARCEIKQRDFVIPTPDPGGAYLRQYSIFRQRQAEFNARIKSFDAQIQSARDAAATAALQLEEVQKQVENAKQMLKMRQEVFAAGHDSKMNLLDAENEYSKYKNQAEALENRRTSSQLQIRRLESDKKVYINNWRKELSTEIAKYTNEMDTYRQRLAKAQRYSQLVDMRAPLDCVVLEIGNISVGSVVKTGETLVKMVPLNDPLEVEARIAPRDIGFIRDGDPCKIKVDAFPFQKHGILEGVLKSIGEDTLIDPENPRAGPYYAVRISLKSTKLKLVPADMRLIPGMTLTAEIVVGSRTVISYILYPMIKMFDESIREP